MRRLRQAISPVAVVLTLLCATAFAQNATNSAELPRFQQVSEKLYRSGQPRKGGLARLRELGINTIVNLRGASSQTRAEEAEARALGLNYVNVPLPNWGRPQDTRVARILELIAAPENGRVLVHCKEGVDRTGMIVAVYRIRNEGWTSHKALAEAEHNGMKRTQFWMRDYVEYYGDRVVKLGPALALQPPGDDAFDDRIGASMRFIERGTFRARKFARGILRRF